jgi:hypothetical protein
MADLSSTQEIVPSVSPQSAPRLIASTLALYQRYPLLFLVLAAGVLVPYELIALLVTGSGQFSRGDAGPGSDFILTLLDLFLITPLISALHLHAVAEVRLGGEPQLATVLRRGLRVLPVVAVAAIVSWLGIAVGFLAFVIPGVILLLRWIVVAQAAATENEGWSAALRRSAELTAGSYGHVILFLLFTTLIVTVPNFLGGRVFGDHDTGAASVLSGLVLHVLTASFTALALALLFFDLLARRGAEAREISPSRPEPEPPAAEAPRWDGPPQDPRAYSDRDRPRGWYVDPTSPDKMRYWRDVDPPGWEGKARTPRKIRQAWRDP